MRRTIEISASFTGKISIGEYENSSPFYAVKEVLEDCEYTDEEIKARQQVLQTICVDQFNKSAQILYQQKIEKAFKNIRFYDAGEGRKYPSVTSCINMDTDFFISQEELSQHSARGTILHKQCEIFLKTGKWVEAKDIPDVSFELMVIKTGTLNLSLDDTNFPNFYKSYPFRVLEQEKTVINHELEFGGRLDILGIIESSNKGSWDKIEGIQFDVPTIFDIKSGSIDKVKCYSQLAAYSKCCDNVAQLVVIPLSKDTQQGFSKPLVTNKIDAYWDIFSKQREKFRSRFGL